MPGKGYPKFFIIRCLNQPEGVIFKMPPKFAEMKVLSDADRRKMQKQREAEKKQQEEIDSQKSQSMKTIIILASLIIFVLVSVVFFYVSSERSNKKQQKEARQVEIKSPSGEIFKLDGKTKIWEKPSKAKLEEGEGVKTGKGGGITVSISKDRSLRLLENSELLVNRIEVIQDNIELLNVDTLFSRGGAVFEIASAPCTFNVDCSFLAVKMPSGFGSMFKIQYGKKDGVENIRVAVKSGRVQVMNKKTKSSYDIEGLNEIYIDKNFKITGPTRFSASSEVF